MQRTQPPTSYCIMSVYQIAYFVAYDNEKYPKLHLHVCRLCLISRPRHLSVIFCTFEINEAFLKSNYAQ